MSLEDEIKKEEEELARLEAEEAEEAEADTEEEETVAETETEEAEEETEKEETEADTEETDKADTEETDKAEDTDEKADEKDEPKNENDVNAKIRIERRERLRAQEELADARRRLEELQARREDRDEQEQPQKQETVEERLDRMENEKYRNDLQKQAIEEFTEIERDFAGRTDDYEDASKHMMSSMYQGVKHAYPQLNDTQAQAFVQKRVLDIASQAARNDMNPAEVLYQMAFDKYGYDSNMAQKTNEQKPEKPQKDLKRVARNKKRAATSLSGGGQTAAASATLEEANNMDLADFGKLSEAEIDELIDQAG